MDIQKLYSLARSLGEAHYDYDHGTSVASKWHKLSEDEVAEIEKLGIDVTRLESAIDDTSSAWQDLESARDRMEEAADAIFETFDTEFRAYLIGSTPGD